MPQAESSITITSIKNDGRSESVFASRTIDLFGESDRRLSEQQAAINFRLRTSDLKYSSSWHVAGDPTLLVILKGSVIIELQNGQKRTFGSGEMFIAEDYLHDDVSFDKQIHGHKACVCGTEELQVLHLKLDSR